MRKVSLVQDSLSEVERKNLGRFWKIRKACIKSAASTYILHPPFLLLSRKSSLNRWLSNLRSAMTSPPSSVPCKCRRRYVCVRHFLWWGGSCEIRRSLSWHPSLPPKRRGRGKTRRVRVAHRPTLLYKLVAQSRPRCWSPYRSWVATFLVDLKK